MIKEGEPGIDGKPAPVTYVPDVVDDADALFKRGCNAGINFDKSVLMIDLLIGLGDWSCVNCTF